MTPNEPREDGLPEEAAGARDRSRHRDTREESQVEPQTAPTEPNSSMPSAGVVWVRISPAQVMRTVVIGLLTAAVVLGAFLLLWQVRSFIGWFVVALFLAVVLNPAVNWLQRRHRLIKRPLAIVLTYLGVVAALLVMVGILVPVLVDQIEGLIAFVASVANAPEGPTEHLNGLAQQFVTAEHAVVIRCPTHPSRLETQSRSGGAIR